MPRKARGPYLWLDKARDSWSIVDGKSTKRTGFTKAQARDAERALAEYIDGKHVVIDSPEPEIADVLAAYLDEHVPHTANPAITKYRLKSLTLWWGGKTLSDVTTTNCRAYAAHREAISKAKKGGGGTAGAREDLAVLRAAIRYWNKHHGPLRKVPEVWMPEKSEGREQWMTRDQIARLLWKSRAYSHEIQREGSKTVKLVRHLSRFIIFGYYTGSRSGVVFTAKYKLFDYDQEFMKRKPHGARKTKKRAPSHKMPKRLKSWLLRWQRIDKGVSEHVVHINGEPIKKLRRSWGTARDAAELPEDVTPHTLRHSRATHLKKNPNVADADAAEFLGMTLQTFQNTYGHHDPEWQSAAADAR